MLKKLMTIKKQTMRLFLSKVTEEFGEKEAKLIVNVWKKLGYDKFSDMSDDMQIDFFIYFTEIFYDAKS